MKSLSAFPSWLVEDFAWKLFSLVLAVAIWLTVHRILQESTLAPANSGSSVLTCDKLPVLIVSTAADVHLYHVVPEHVKVTVTGSPDAIATLQASQIRPTVDLTGIGFAKELKRNVDVSVPSGVTIVRVEPAKVDVIVPPTP